MASSVRSNRLPFVVVVLAALLGIALTMMTLERWLPAPDRTEDEAASLAAFAGPTRPVLKEEEDGTIAIEFGSDLMRIRTDDPESREAYLACVSDAIEREFPDPASSQDGDTVDPDEPPVARPDTGDFFDRIHAACFEEATLVRPSAVPPGDRGAP